MLYFGLLALLQELGYAFLLWFSPILDQHFQLLPIFLGVWGILFLLYFFSLKNLQKKISSHFSVDAASTSLLSFILFAGLVFRFTALFIQNLVLSHDLYIYMWYGRLQTHGFNPYLYTAMDPILSHLRDSNIWNHVAFKHILPIYPAFLMKCFHLAYWIGGDSLIQFKLLQLVPEAMTLVAGIALLKAYGKSPLWILSYAWCPLPIVEYLGMGHSDAWGIALVTLFLLFFKKHKFPLAAICLALATMVKLFPIIFAPLIFTRLLWKQRFQFCVFFVSTVLIFYLPFISAREKILGVLPTFLKSYEFNGSVYPLLYWMIGRGDWAHWASNILILIWAILVASLRLSWERALMATLVGFFFLSYHIFPWYLGYFLPLLLLLPNWGAYAWLATSILSYMVLVNYRSQGRWEESPLIVLIEYLPVYGLMVWQWVRAWKAPHPAFFPPKTSSNIYSPSP